jgi:hypothetical protein
MVSWLTPTVYEGHAPQRQEPQGVFIVNSRHHYNTLVGIGKKQKRDEEVM